MGGVWKVGNARHEKWPECDYCVGGGGASFALVRTWKFGVRILGKVRLVKVNPHRARGGLEVLKVFLYEHGSKASDVGSDCSGKKDVFF